MVRVRGRVRGTARARFRVGDRMRDRVRVMVRDRLRVRARVRVRACGWRPSSAARSLLPSKFLQSEHLHDSLHRMPACARARARDRGKG